MASSDVQITLGADASAAVQGLAQFNTSLSGLAPQVANLASAFGALATRVSGLSNSVDGLAKSLKAAGAQGGDGLTALQKGGGGAASALTGLTGWSWMSIVTGASPDVHPPLYYLSAFLFTRLTGLDELGMRLFSALCAGAAVAAFVGGTGVRFSLTARLFAAASATSSFFWFYQAQNALTMLIGAGIVALSVELIGSSTDRRELRKSSIVGLFVLCVIDASVHFYGLLLGAATLIALAAAIPAKRIACLTLAASIVILGGAYIELVERRFVSPDVVSTWIGSSPAWYRDQLVGVVIQAFGRGARLIAGVCLLAGIAAFSANRRARLSARPALATLLFGASVPALVFVGGILASLVFKPSLTDRNVLVAAPFIWPP